MLTDLDESLRQLLIQKAGLAPVDVDISFEPPTRDWAAGSAAGRPTVNLYLYDLRENVSRRETHRDTVDNRNGTAARTRRPLRFDGSYMITCWTSVIEDQHRLLWRVLETVCRHSPLPPDILQGELRTQRSPVRTEIAQPEGTALGLAEYWAALGNNLRPGIPMKVTLDLDLNQVEVRPLVLARITKLGRLETESSTGAPALGPNWEPGRLDFGGLVQRPGGEPLAGASVRLIGLDAAGRPRQLGPTEVTGADGRYRFAGVPAGEYTLAVETPGRPPVNTPLRLRPPGPAEAVPGGLRPIEVPSIVA